MKLRSYEERAVTELLRRLENHRNIVAVAPTGSGKTVIGAALLQSLKHVRVLWLAHRIELLRQAYTQLLAAGLPENDAGIMHQRPSTRPTPRVLVAGVGMFRTRAVPQVDLVVVDEAHHVMASSYRAILDQVPKARCLGLTATPWRLDGKPLGDVFDDLFVMADAVELIADGFIMESVVYGVPREKAVELVRGLVSTGGDYSPRKLAAVMRKQPLMADIVQEWHRLAKGRPTIVYACNIEHAEDLAQRFRRAGVTTEVLDWLTPDAERAAILGTLEKPGRLATGETTVVVNVGILTEGIDCPPVKCIVLARPTKSLTLHRQMCGRGSRPSGQQLRPLILDHAGNTWRLGLPEMAVEWSLSSRISFGGSPPVKICKATVDGQRCGAMNPIAARTCSECGAEFPLTERELRERDAKLERIRATTAERRRKASILRALAKEKGLGEDWVRQRMGDYVA